MENCNYSTATALYTAFYKLRLDIQQIAVSLQRSVRIMRQYPLCQYLAKLYALLVEAVQVPCEALEHNLILKMRQQRAQSLRSQLIAYNDAGGTAACKVLVAILVFLAARRSVFLEVLSGRRKKTA